MLRLIVTLVLFFTSYSSYAHAAAGFQIELSAPNLKLAERQSIRSFLREAESILPPSLKQQINRKVYVQFEKLGNGKPLNPPVCPGYRPNDANGSSESPKVEDQFFGKAKGPDQIYLNSEFISEILKGPEQARAYSCGFKNMYRFALGTLLHEIAHLGDTVSSERLYRKAIGWKRHSITKIPYPKNKIGFRSPDFYENQNIAEHFAVNFSYFLLDPEYSCRRPILSRFFRKKFGVQPQSNCELNFEVPVGSYDLLGGSKRMSHLDPNRIFEIQLMVAAPGRDASAVVGHTMFRIIVCSPTREGVSPECRKDVEHHIVISYTAFTQSSSYKIWKGLVGDYPSLLFLLPFREVLEEYTERDLREVWSYPLNLSKEEKELFILRVLEQYWEYQGTYVFFTNNCTTEAVDLMKAVIHRPVMTDYSPWTPLSMKDKTNLSQLLKFYPEGELMDRAEARRQGFLYPAAKESIEKAYLAVEVYFGEKYPGSKFPWKSMSQYFKKSSANERNYFYTFFGNAPRAIVSNLAYLEYYIHFEKLLALTQLVGDRMESEKDGGASILDEGRKTVRISMPYTRAKRGYGIPLPSDFDEKLKDEGASPQLFEALEAWKEKLFPNETQELRDIKANMKSLASRLKKAIQQELKTK